MCNDGLSQTDLEAKAQRDRAAAELYKAYAIVFHFGALDAAGVGQFVDNMLAAGVVAEVDAMLLHLDVCAGAWRELADKADRFIERVAETLTRAVLERAVVVEAGSA